MKHKSLKMLQLLRFVINSWWQSCAELLW